MVLAESPIQVIGAALWARAGEGAAATGIATVFPRQRAVVTLPGIHASQREAFVEQLEQERTAAGQPALTPPERMAVWRDAVDLIVQEGIILIRPDPQNMALAFQADELLQELVSKRQIRFLYTTDGRVRDAIKRRGECWRIVPLPASAVEMGAMIRGARLGVGGRRIYYYNPGTGTHVLTCQEFAALADLDDAELRRHLEEIRDLAARYNRLGYPEISFFQADATFSAAVFTGRTFADLDAAALRAAHQALAERFAKAVLPEFRRDDPADLPWRNRMFAALTGQWDAAVPEESLLGLSPEFYMQIQWLPGARIEEGELLFDSVLTEPAAPGSAAGGNAPGSTAGNAGNAPTTANGLGDLTRHEEKLRGFIFNYLREYGDLEYVNIGRVVASLADRPAAGGRRDVFLAELKGGGQDGEIVHVIRMAKWGVAEHLDEGRDLLTAMIEAEEYIDYVLDRRLGCRQLGMSLPRRMTARRLAETYRGKQAQFRGTRIWATYFERDYIGGLATTKLPPARLRDGDFAMQLARLLGLAAAPNLIVGRADVQGRVMFDDGDEVVVEDAAGVPVDLAVADPTGAFTRYDDPLAALAPSYASPVQRRRVYLADPGAFLAAYLAGFVERFTAIQQEYRRRRRAFDTLFKHRPQEPAGAFGHRWRCVLARLDQTDAAEVAQVIRANVKL